MQNKLSDINKKVAEKYDLDEELLNSISSTVFKELSYKLNNPNNLIVYIKGLGKFYSRKKKAEDTINKIKYVLEHPKGFLNLDKMKSNLKSLEFLMDKYKEFYKHKQEFTNANNDNTNN